MGNWSLTSVSVLPKDGAATEVPIDRCGGLFWNASARNLARYCGWGRRHFEGYGLTPVGEGAFPWRHTHDLAVSMVIKDPLCEEPPIPMPLQGLPNPFKAGSEFGLKITAGDDWGASKTLQLDYDQLQHFAGLLWEATSGRGPNRMLAQLTQHYPPMAVHRRGRPNPLKSPQGLVFFLDETDFHPNPWG